MLSDEMVFLAYAKEDKEFVKKFRNELLSRGINPWFDEQSLDPGIKWEGAIKDAIRNSRFFLAFISRNSTQKNGYIHKELKLGLLELEKKPPGRNYFIPILLEDIDMPNYSVDVTNIRDFHAVRIFEKDQREKLLSYLSNSFSGTYIKGHNIKFQEVIDCLLSGETDKALDNLNDELKSYESENLNDAIILQTKWRRLKHDYYVKRILSDDDFYVRFTQLNDAILKLIDLEGE